MTAERDGVLSIHELRACGLDGHAIARRVRDGRLHRLHRGVYAVGHPGLTLRGRFRAAGQGLRRIVRRPQAQGAGLDPPDADKQAMLEAAGLRVLRITWAQITRSPQQTLARVRVALG